MWGWAQVAMARKSTETLVHGTALVLAPHPDDETIGCGLLLAKKAQDGYGTSVLLATDGERGWFSSMPRPEPDAIVRIRYREWHRALDVLAVAKERRFTLGFPDGTLCDHEEEASKRIGDLLRSLAPTQIFVTGPHDAHPDHRVLARATRRAVAAVYGTSTGPDGHSPPALYHYRVDPAGGIWVGDQPEEPNLGMTLRQLARSAIGLIRRRPLALRASGVTSAKAVAIKAYESQRKLLDGELRYVWRSDVELFWKVDLSDPSG
jgi:LmbE family N-acetylglucosaminyl deacetylase